MTINRKNPADAPARASAVELVSARAGSVAAHGVIYLEERILRLPEVMRMTGLGRDCLYAMARRGAFKKPIKLTSRASGWRLSEVLAWIREREAAR